MLVLRYHFIQLPEQNPKEKKKNKQNSNRISSCKLSYVINKISLIYKLYIHCRWFAFIQFSFSGFTDLLE